MLSKNTRNFGGGTLPGFQSCKRNLRSKKLPSGCAIGRTTIAKLERLTEQRERNNFSSSRFKTFLMSTITDGDIVADVMRYGQCLRGR